MSALDRLVNGEYLVWILHVFTRPGNDCYIAIENGHRNSEDSHKKHGDFPHNYISSGKRLHNELENHHAINGKTHFFDWAMASIANCECLPEGKPLMHRCPLNFLHQIWEIVTW